MDKNFFKFDIDDEIMFNEQTISTPEKTQNINNNSKKCLEYDNFICFKHNNSKLKNNLNYQKKYGLQNQKNINSNISLVEDYINFDFRSKFKQMKEKQDFDDKEYLLTINDKEVKDVINKAHIGVIFY